MRKGFGSFPYDWITVLSTSRPTFKPRFSLPFTSLFTMVFVWSGVSLHRIGKSQIAIRSQLSWVAVFSSSCADPIILLIISKEILKSSGDNTQPRSNTIII